MRSVSDAITGAADSTVPFLPITEMASGEEQDISIVEFPLIDKNTVSTQTGDDIAGASTTKSVQLADPSVVRIGSYENDPTTGSVMVLQDLTAFLKVTYNVNWDFTKFVTVGLFKEYEFHLGALFHKQGNRRYVLVDYAQFLELEKLASSVTYALTLKSVGDNDIDNKQQKQFNVSGGIKIVLRKTYGRSYVEIKDTKRKTRVSFSENEWMNFVDILPCICRYVEKITCVESYWIEHIERVMRSNSVYVPPPQQVNGWDADRLHDEIVVYKKVMPIAH